MLTLRPADAGGSFKHVLRVGWLVFWQETERGNCRFSFFSPKSDLLGLNVHAARTSGSTCSANIIRQKVIHAYYATE